MSDALWQAQDDRLGSDGVFVIPGPRSVAGIRHADEPVAELLARFEREAIDRVLAADVRACARDRLADPGPVPSPLAEAIAGHRGPIAALCGAASLLVAEAGGTRARPNPLWRLVAAGDEIHAVRDEHGELGRIEALPAGATGERLEVTADGEDVLVTVRMPSVDGAPDELVMRWRPAGAGSFAAVDGDAGSIAFARQVLGAGAAATPGDPLHPVRASWTLPAELAGAHRAATGAEHAGTPLDVALTLAWPALAVLLSSTPFAARLAQLVHSGHSVAPGSAWPPRDGEHGHADVRVEALDDPDGAPTRLTCSAVLTKRPR